MEHIENESKVTGAQSALNDGLVNQYVTVKAPEIEPYLVFNCGTEVMRLDKDGMTYKAFLEVMRLMKNELK